MPNPLFGTAHLFGLVADHDSRRLLASAYAAGFRQFDTAPSYGFGESEPELGMFASGLDPAPLVTSKVGILPVARPSQSVRFAKSVARHLPSAIQQKLRGPDGPAGHGNFDVPTVTDSVDESLRRLGRLERLLLHEVRPADITDELLARLVTYRDRGDVGHLGIATGNDVTLGCLARAPQTFDTVHFSAGPLSEPLVLPDSVTIRVGHGVLGPGAAHLRELQTRLADDDVLAERWRSTGGDPLWSGPNGLANALLARTTTLDLTDVIVATSRPEKLPAIYGLVTGQVQLPPELLAVLNDLVGKA